MARGYGAIHAGRLRRESIASLGYARRHLMPGSNPLDAGNNSISVPPYIVKPEQRGPDGRSLAILKFYDRIAASLFGQRRHFLLNIIQ
jgi:hypothetical protein